MENITLPRVVGTLGIYCVLDALCRIFLSSPAKLPYQKLLAAAQKRFNTSGEFPLQNKIAIVTGSTSGLGLQVATELYRMGCTVILASRTKSKMIEVADEIRKQYPNSQGRLVLDQAMDTSDLDSVVEFAKWFKSNYITLHFLVNNAGIVYLPSQTFDPAAPPTSKQGYDAAFATNYLGHFLLTELLLPTLKKTGDARILSVASSAHLTVSGSDLLCGEGSTRGPKCARPVETTAAFFGAYGNNKTAQIMHVKALQEELDSSADANGLKMSCCCPGFTATGMVPDTLLGNTVKKIFFLTQPAALAPLHALLGDDIAGGEFLTNFFLFWTDGLFGKLWFRVSCAIGMRVPFAGFVAIPWVMAFQNSSYGVHKSTPDGLAQNPKAVQDLFAWSRQEVKPYVDRLAKMKVAQ